jgi:DNA helicase-2/ATP-dependent DNA helicase PcrA
MEPMNQLNARQLSAVTATEGYIRVIAGAGSGKTRTLTTRYAYLVEELGVAPGRVMSVTFTNKAANEMKHRIRRILGDVDTGMIGTFHGFCLRVLKEDIHRLNYPQNFAVMDEEDQKSVLQEIYEELGLSLKNYTFRNMLNIIGYYKTSYGYVGDLVEPGEERFVRYANSFGPDMKERVLGRYIQKQRKNFMLDFDDIINFTLFLFTGDAEALQKWQALTQYIQVDEFQDVDGKQAELVYMLSRRYGNLFVVGDPDQTIYSWRGADVSIILDFDRVFPQARTIVLDENYRSTPQILDVSNLLIRHNQVRLDKELKAIRPDGCRAVYSHTKTVEAEARLIAAEVKKLRDENAALHDIAVLYRAHYLSRSLEEVFVGENIPYVLYNGVEFYRRREIKDLLCYLRMLVSGDDIAFLRTVNMPRRNIGKKRVAYLQGCAEQNGMMLYDVLRLNPDADIFRGTRAKEYIGLIEHYRNMNGHISISELLDGLLRDSGYEEKLMRDADQDRIDNVAELKNSIQQYEDSNGEEVLLEDYLNKIALFTNLDTADRADSVRMMTVHSAKGLEFPYVFICGFSEGIFPSGRIKSREEMEEERRLAYVAFTRAKQRLYISDSEGINDYSGFRYPSRFLFDVGLEHFDVAHAPGEEYLAQSRRFIRQSDERLDGKNKTDLAIGDHVEHPVFGGGVVESVGDSGYTIHFPKLGSNREIGKAYAKLKRV